MIPAPSAEELTAYPGISTPWPLESHLELGVLAAAVPCARHHARQMLAQWHLNGHVEAVELVVSELVTNAVRACAGMPPGASSVRLWLCSDCDRVLVRVWDGNGRMPVRQCLGPGAESGRGLLLVDSLSAEWGAYRPAALGGKVVWAMVAG